ncbi:MAG: hypothetical protein JNM59_06000 [Hyphomonadaceae bacterium]|nr:hypothetical protein [Hyphomonadaceae bacterium]
MRFRWFGALLVVIAALWVAQFSLRVAPLSVDGPLPGPSPLSAFEGDPPITSAEEWMVRRAPLLRAAFQNFVYGSPPAATPPAIARRRVIDEHAFGGLGRLEELQLVVHGPRGDASFALLVATPRQIRGSVPVVIAPNFCGNAAAVGRRYRALAEPVWLAPRCRTLVGRALARAMQGAHIVRPAFRELLSHGYAVATFSPGEIAPDDARLAVAALARLPDASADRLGAVGAWAWAISRVVDVVSREPGIDASRIAVFGHSRFGKAALWATATDMRIGAVIANQSGRLGASPSESHVGETLRGLFRRYPHWFPRVVETEGVSDEIDQHLLLALIAPRPILLNGATLDRWSDPAGAFRAAEAASPVYALFGRVGLDQADMRSTNLDADIAFYLRPGGHGVRASDWATARAFLDAHFKAV